MAHVFFCGVIVFGNIRYFRYNKRVTTRLKEETLYMAKKHHFKAWEDQIIRDRWQTTTDEQIAKEIGRTTEAIGRRRKALGFSKAPGRPPNKIRKEAVIAHPTEYSLATLSKDDRIAFYRSQFDKNHRYPFLLKILIDDELPYYQHKYIEFLDNVESITLQEEEILHNMLMTEIQILRLQEQISEAIRAYRDDNEDKRPPPQHLYKDLNDAEVRYAKYHKDMNLTREQRLKANKEEKITITSMVSALLDARNREKAGKSAGIMSYFSERCRDDMNKMDFLIGG